MLNKNASLVINFNCLHYLESLNTFFFKESHISALFGAPAVVCTRQYVKVCFIVWNQGNVFNMAVYE